ncbi:MAG: DUF4831 family protein [Rikenellaceae bacterium]
MKYILTLMAMVATYIASAQQLPPIAIGVVGEGANVTVVDAPTSTIFVDISLTQTKFTAGIYARYAQKYLGERAALINRESTNITQSTIALAPQNYFVASAEVAPNVVVTNSPASTLPVNTTSADITIPEGAAADAAQQIFTNRKLSYDLIAGNIGEGVFGSGLATALDRLDNTEKNLLALFMGSETSTTSTQRFIINLTPETKRYIICRYDSSRGIISSNEIDGEPVYLQITPQAVADTTYTLTLSKYPQRKTVVSANPSKCDLYVGAKVIKSSTLPLYDFGQRTTIIYNPK